jgi:ACS family tartrate transporter-like MFS transporter
MDEAIEKSAMRKVYVRLLPFAILSYFLAYIDRINVSFAGLTMRVPSAHRKPYRFRAGFGCA